jgi:hypothetical protein
MAPDWHQTPLVGSHSGVHFSGQKALRALALTASVCLHATEGLVAESSGNSEQVPGDRGLAIRLIPFNRLANSTFESRATSEDLPIPQWLTVTDASSTSPIQLTTPIPHGLETGDEVAVTDVLGNEGANGWWKVRVIGPDRFALEDSRASGAYAGGGAIYPARGQPVPPGGANEAGELAWTPWHSVPAAIPATEFFRSDGAHPTGEVSTFVPLPPASSFLAQEIDGSLFEPGERLCLSVEARVARPATNRQSIVLSATAAFQVARVYRVTFPFSALTGEYQRFALCFALDNRPIPAGGVLRVQFITQMAGGEPQPVYWARPMLHEGLEPAPWTPAVELTPRTRPFR